MLRAELAVLPRVLLKAKRVVRHLARPEESALTGPETQASWYTMIARLNREDYEARRRLADAERALNRLSLD